MLTIGLHKFDFGCEESSARAMIDITQPCISTARMFRSELMLFSVCVVCLSCCLGDSGTDFSSPNNIEDQNQFVERAEFIRLAKAKLQRTLKSSPIVAEKIAPVVAIGSNDTKITVKMDFAIASVLSIDDAKEVMTTSAYIRVSWVDPALSWNVSQHLGLPSVELPVQTVWTPGIYIANSLDKKKLFDYTDSVTVLHNGTATGYFDHIVHTYCDMHLGRYPYDTQHCPLVVESFSSSLRITLSAYIFDDTFSSAMSYSSGWDLVAQRINTLDNFGASVSLSCEVRRKTLFYTACLVSPMVMTSIMNTLVFLMPLQSGEKVSFLVSIFVSTSVFTSFFTTGMPRGLDSMPKTMKLLVGVIVENLLILLATLFVMARNDSERDHSERASSEVVSSQVQTSSPEQGHAAAEGHVSARVQPYASHVFDENNARGRLPCTDETTAKRLNDEVGHASMAPRGSPSCFGLTGSCVNGCLKVTAKRLDRLFFILAFVGNAVFLSVLLLE